MLAREYTGQRPVIDIILFCKNRSTMITYHITWSTVFKVFFSLLTVTSLLVFWQILSFPLAHPFPFNISQINKHLAWRRVKEWETSKIVFDKLLTAKLSLREKCPNTELFLVRLFLYSDWIQENKDQKKLRIWTLFMQYVLLDESHKPKQKDPAIVNVLLHSKYEINL